MTVAVHSNHFIDFYNGGSELISLVVFINSILTMNDELDLFQRELKSTPQSTFFVYSEAYL